MIKLYYRWNKVDGVHEYYLATSNEKGEPFTSAWTQWIYFGLGKAFGENGVTVPVIFPYRPIDPQIKPFAKWVGTIHPATTYGQIIAKKIISHLVKVNKNEV